MDPLHAFWHNLTHNLFKPLLLFFYMGFLIPILRIKFEFPKALYQGLTIYLLIAIGWHGGEELASVSTSELGNAFGFMVIGFALNFIIGLIAYLALRFTTKLRQVDAATVAGYYGSDSAGTFVTCVGVLLAANIAYAAYMPVMLAIMEIPGCLVALYLVSRLRTHGLDRHGNMPDEPGYRPAAEVVAEAERSEKVQSPAAGAPAKVAPLCGEAQAATAVAVAEQPPGPGSADTRPHGHTSKSRGKPNDDGHDGLEPGYYKDSRLGRTRKPRGFLDPQVLHEVFLNPALFLLFGGIAIGFIGRIQGSHVTATNDPLFVSLFQGVLCLFLLEMGMAACLRIKDLKAGGWRFVVCALIFPNVFAILGIGVAHSYSLATGHAFELGTYVLFAVLCAAASYIAVPAVQRMAIPEASPTLPLAASLGLTFSYNVTIGIPLYIEIAKGFLSLLPVGG